MGKLFLRFTKFSCVIAEVESGRLFGHKPTRTKYLYGSSILPQYGLEKPLSFHISRCEIQWRRPHFYVLCDLYLHPFTCRRRCIELVEGAANANLLIRPRIVTIIEHSRFKLEHFDYLATNPPWFPPLCYCPLAALAWMLRGVSTEFLWLRATITLTQRSITPRFMINTWRY